MVIDYSKNVVEELDQIIEHSYDGIWVTDGNGVVLKVNSACERISGITPKKNYWQVYR